MSLKLLFSGLRVVAFSVALVGCKNKEQVDLDADLPAPIPITQAQIDSILDESEITEDCGDARRFSTMITCKYSSVGPLGFNINMPLGDLTENIAVVLKAIDDDIMLTKFASEGGFSLGGIEPGDPILEKIMWADELSIDHRRFRRNGFLVIYLDGGIITEIKWFWGIK